MKAKISKEPPEPSFIREILKAAAGIEGLISFAGGIPNRKVIRDNIVPNISRAMMELYPDPDSYVLSLFGLNNIGENLPENLQEISDLLSEEVEYKGTILSDLSYGATPGTTPFRETIAEIESERLQKEISPKEIQVLSGSQEGIDLVSTLFGKKTIMSEATYVGAIPIIRYNSEKILTVPIDDYGMDIDSVEKILKKETINMVYVIPHGQNPMGVRLSTERRKHLLKLAQKNSFMILEDDPYYGTSIDPELNIASYDSDFENTILLRSFSKELFPARVGYALGSQENLEKLERLKSARNLHTSKLDQILIVNLIKTLSSKHGSYSSYLKTVAQIYQDQGNSMLNALELSFSDLEVSLTRPKEGFFIWATFPEQLDTLKIYPDALKQKIAYVPGAPFDPNWKPHHTNSMSSSLHNSMRLNYSYPTRQEIFDGSKRLADLVNSQI